MKRILNLVIFLSLLSCSEGGKKDSKSNNQSSSDATATENTEPKPVTSQPVKKPELVTTGNIIVIFADDVKLTTVTGYLEGHKGEYKLDKFKGAEEGQLKFIVAKVEPGTYTLILNSVSPKTPENQKEQKLGLRMKDIVVKAQENTELKDVRMPTTGNISGTVEVVGSDDPSGIKVTIPGTTFSATSDAAGNYLIESVPPGLYSIIFENEDASATATFNNFEVEPGAVSEVQKMLIFKPTFIGAGVELLEGDDDGITGSEVTLLLIPPEGANQVMISEDPTFEDAGWKHLVTTTTYSFSESGVKTLFFLFSKNGDQKSAVYSKTFEVNL